MTSFFNPGDVLTIPKLTTENTATNLARQWLGPPRNFNLEGDASQKYVTYTYPDAFIGKNKFLGVLIYRRIIQNNDFLFNILPIMHTDQPNISWDEMRFEDTLFGETPELGTSRIIKSSRSSNSASIIRRGLGIMTEIDFYKTEMGQKTHLEKMECMARSALETMKFDIFNTLLIASSNISLRERELKYFTNAARDLVLASLQYEKQLWAIVQKEKYGAAQLDAIVDERTSSVGNKLTEWIMPADVKAIALFTRSGEMLDYAHAGPEGQKRLSGAGNMYNDESTYGIAGGKVNFSRLYAVDRDRANVDPLMRKVQIGEYNTMFPQKYLDMEQIKNYTSNQRSIMVYDEDKDSFVLLSLKWALENCAVFDDDGKINHYPIANEYEQNDNRGGLDSDDDSDDDTMMGGGHKGSKSSGTKHFLYVGDINKPSPISTLNEMNPKYLPKELLQQMAITIKRNIINLLGGESVLYETFKEENLKYTFDDELVQEAISTKKDEKNVAAFLFKLSNSNKGVMKNLKKAMDYFRKIIGSETNYDMYENDSEGYDQEPFGYFNSTKPKYIELYMNKVDAKAKAEQIDSGITFTPVEDGDIIAQSIDDMVKSLLEEYSQVIKEEGTSKTIFKNWSNKMKESFSEHTIDYASSIYLYLMFLRFFNEDYSESNVVPPFLLYDEAMRNVPVVDTIPGLINEMTKFHNSFANTNKFDPLTTAKLEVIKRETKNFTTTVKTDIAERTKTKSTPVTESYKTKSTKERRKSRSETKQKYTQAKIGVRFMKNSNNRRSIKGYIPLGIRIDVNDVGEYKGKGLFFYNQSTGKYEKVEDYDESMLKDWFYYTREKDDSIIPNIIQNMENIDGWIDDPIEQMFLRILLQAPVTKDVMMNFISNDITFPFSFIIARPHATYSTLSAIKLNPTDLGNVYTDNPDVRVEMDAQTKFFFIHTTFRSKAIVRKPDSVYVAHNIASKRYWNGMGIKTYKKNVQYEPRSGDNFSRGANRSAFVFAVPYNEKLENVFLDASGSFAYLKLDVVSDKDLKKIHYSTCDYYNKYWKFRSTEGHDTVHLFSDSMERSVEHPDSYTYAPMNTIMWQGEQISYNPSTKKMDVVQTNMGHWGDTVYPGCASIRNGGFKEFKKPAFNGQFTAIPVD